MNALPRSFNFGGQMYVVVNASIGFSLSQNNLLYATQDLLKVSAPWIDKVNVLGDGLPIGCGEWLLAGSAHAPDQVPSEKWIVSAKLGASKKRLNVYGERRFDGSAIQSIKAKTQVSLTWEQSWGGATVQENSQGCGLRESDGAVIVPSVEYPDFSWSNPDTHSKPASMLPIESTHPLRQKYVGSYGDNYLKDFFPGLPDDCSWKYFNLASIDQQIEGYWEGDEKFELQNLHPKYSLIEGNLPELRPRIWISKKEAELEEVPLQLARVIFFPEAMIGVMVYQGLVSSNSLVGADIERILGAIESMQEPKLQDSYYEEVWQKRTGANIDSALASLDDRLLCSKKYEIYFSALDGVFKDDEKRKAFKQSSRKRAESAQLMLDRALREADKFGDSETSKKQIQDVVAKISDSFSTAEKNSEAGYGKNISELSQYIKNVREELGSQLNQSPQIESLIEQSKQSLLDAKKSINDISSQSKQFNPLEGSIKKPHIEKEIKEGLKKLEELVFGAAPIGHEKEWVDIQKNWGRYKKFLSDDSELPNSDGGFKSRIEIIQEIMEARPEKSNMQDLIQELEALISNVESENPQKGFKTLVIEDLKKPHTSWPHGDQDYELHDFRSWNFKERKISKLRFSKCYFHQCDLSDSIWEDCIFDACDLSEINITNASFINVTFLHCRLTSSTAPNSKWKRSKFIECEAPFSFWENSNWEGSSFLRTDLIGSLWSDSKFTRTTMLECNLRQSMFISLNANRASWLNCDLTDGVWNKASLLGSVFYQNKMAKKWRESTMNYVSLRSANLDGSDFQDASFNSVDFSEACLSNCNLKGLKSKNTQFVRAQLNGSDISQSIFENSNLVEANLCGTSFAGSDLIASWFGNTLVDDATQWQLARTNTSCFYPKRRVH